MNEYKIHKAMLAIAPIIFSYSKSPLTPKGHAELSEKREAFFYDDEYRVFRGIVETVMNIQSGNLPSPPIDKDE